jgi:predicted transcriptional regulator
MSKSKRKLKAWSIEEVDFLENNCGTMSVKRIAKKLKRTETSVSQKMRKLGYTKTSMQKVKEEQEKPLTRAEKLLIFEANNKLDDTIKKSHQQTIDDAEEFLRQMKDDRDVIEVDIDGLLISFNKWTRKVKIKTR